jgi:hypothetical protein
MWSCFITLHLDDYLKIFALLGASIAFGVGLLQYRRAQRWKRAEFLANEMKDFLATPRVQKALLLIDWGCREIQLLEDRPTDESWVTVTRQMQTMGLRPHILLDRTGSDSETFTVDEAAPGEGFTQSQAAIRDCYDAFLDGLEKFASHAKAGLIDLPSLRPYIGYWVDDISSPTDNVEDAAWCAALLTYVSFYRFEDVLWLFDRFGSSIRPSSTVYNSFLKLMLDQELARQLAGAVKCNYP